MAMCAIKGIRSGTKHLRAHLSQFRRLIERLIILRSRCLVRIWLLLLILRGRTCLNNDVIEYGLYRQLIDPKHLIEYPLGLRVLLPSALCLLDFLLLGLGRLKVISALFSLHLLRIPLSSWVVHKSDLVLVIWCNCCTCPLEDRGARPLIRDISHAVGSLDIELGVIP